MVSDETTVVDKDGQAPKDIKNGNSALKEEDGPSESESDWPGDYNESNDEQSQGGDDDDDPEVTPNDGSKAMMSSGHGTSEEGAESTPTAQVKPPSPSNSSSAVNGETEEDDSISIQTVPNVEEGPSATSSASGTLGSAEGAGMTAAQTVTSAPR